MKKGKISFCTVSQNRLHHLMKTLPVNLFDTRNFGNIEFVILDYNSSDDLENFIKECMFDHIASGLLVYYKTFIPEYFHRSHSRNLAFKLATGDLLCNIDADNFIGKGFIPDILRSFSRDQNIFLSTVGIQHRKIAKDNLGKICLRKSDFEKIRGYDELMECYGFEDYDFVNRLKMITLKPIGINTKHLKSINHTNQERVENEFLVRNFKDLYVRFLTPATTEILFILKNGKFKMGTLIDNKANCEGNYAKIEESQKNYAFSIVEDAWKEGDWQQTSQNLHLKFHGLEPELFVVNVGFNSLTGNEKKFIRIDEADLIMQSVMFYSEITNRLLMFKNMNNEKAIVNDNAYGAGCVFKNFNYNTPIYV